MIGIIKDECYMSIELWPVFGSEKGIPRWASFSFECDCENYGEYGIAWSWHKGDLLPSVWLSYGLTTYTSFKSFYRAWKTKTLF